MKRDVKNHGQHFLRGRSLIAELVGHSNLRSRDTVLDIGAGTGAITHVLAGRVAKVVAYEPEPEAARVLTQNMQHSVNVTVHQTDFMSADLPTTPYKVFSNIPFRLSSQIIRKLVWAPTSPRAIYLIVQKQFAQKLLSTGDHFHGALGMAIAPWWVARIRRPLRKTDFTPPPAVDTVLLELKPREEPLLPVQQQRAYAEFVEACYAKPAVYHKAGGSQTRRPSQLSVQQWCALYSRNAK